MFFWLAVFLNDCLNEKDSYDSKQHTKADVLRVYIWIYLQCVYNSNTVCSIIIFHWIISSGAPAATVQATWWTKVIIWMKHSPPPLPLPPPHQKMWPSLRMTLLTNKGQVSFTSLMLQLTQHKTPVECRSIQVGVFFLNVSNKVHGL